MESKANQQIPSHRIEQLLALLKQLNIDPKEFKCSKFTNKEPLLILNEALTHTSANEAINHERLEFLGDAVLRLAASEYIDRNYPNMKVGDRSALRAQIVSDKWLAKVGQNLSIKKILIMGIKAAKDLSASETIEAESTEALIGAIYECLNDLKPIHSWLEPHWKKESMIVLSDPHKQNSKSALQEWSQARGQARPEYQIEERSQQHGDPRRFFCKVCLEGEYLGEGWGRSRRDAEKEAARESLKKINSKA